MPLRSAAQFYHPTFKEKTASGIKVFPQRLQPKLDILTPKGDPEPIRTPCPTQSTTSADSTAPGSCPAASATVRTVCPPSRAAVATNCATG